MVRFWRKHFPTTLKAVLGLKPWRQKLLLWKASRRRLLPTWPKNLRWRRLLISMLALLFPSLVRSTWDGYTLTNTMKTSSRKWLPCLVQRTTAWLWLSIGAVPCMRICRAPCLSCLIWYGSAAGHRFLLKCLRLAIIAICLLIGVYRILMKF